MGREPSTSPRPPVLLQGATCEAREQGGTCEQGRAREQGEQRGSVISQADATRGWEATLGRHNLAVLRTPCECASRSDHAECMQWRG